jgi:formamidopyrimidine-DNA glycosylase
MPELPEVETVARQLAPLVEGRRVQRLRIFDPRLRVSSTPRVAGRRITGVARSGKRILIEFSGVSRKSQPLWLAVHLRMTGRLFWEPPGSAGTKTHLRARFDLDRGAMLFTDTRRFGTFDWFRSLDAATPTGQDPLDPRFNAQGLAALIGNSTQQIKLWLLRQDRLVGLGNIYASEILHAARIAPSRAVASLKPREVRALHTEMRRILKRAIKACGTTFSDFRDARGVEGSYSKYLNVYGKAGEACLRCGAAIERVVQGQRSTFHCAGCQR